MGMISRASTGTIGMPAVAALAAWAGPFVAMATMTDTCRRTRSAANAGSRLY